MTNYTCINGYTKEKMKQMIRERNNGKVARAGGHCKYLTPDGNRCAAGVFIPDGHEAQQVTASIQRLLDGYPDLCEKMPLDSCAMTTLQGLHDLYRGDGDMRDVLCAWIDIYVQDATAQAREGEP